MAQFIDELSFFGDGGSWVVVVSHRVQLFGSVVELYKEVPVEIVPNFGLGHHGDADRLDLFRDVVGQQAGVGRRLGVLPVVPRQFLAWPYGRGPVGADECGVAGFAGQQQGRDVGALGSPFDGHVPFVDGDLPLEGCLVFGGDEEADSLVLIEGFTQVVRHGGPLVGVRVNF